MKYVVGVVANGIGQQNFLAQPQHEHDNSDRDVVGIETKCSPRGELRKHFVVMRDRPRDKMREECHEQHVM